MKLVAYTCVVFILLTCAVIPFLRPTSNSSNAPRFQQAQAPASPIGIFYDFMNLRPFETGKMWIYAQSSGTNNQLFIYDIERREVLGNITNCWPAMLFGEPLKLLCYQPRPNQQRNGLKQRLLTFLERISGGRIKLPPAMNWQTYWLIDLKNNVAKRIGDIPIADSLIASPDFRYCFAFGVGQTGRPQDYLLDLRKRVAQQLETPALGWTYGWWDNTRLLLKTTNCDFILYDVPHRKVSPLISFETLSACLMNGKVSDDPKQTQSFAIWNGRENDFYLTDTHQKWAAGDSFLIKVERPDGRLKLVSPSFKFEWSDHLDQTGRYYLYTGRDSGHGSDGVFLRDLELGINRVLVPPTTNTYFAMPRFYGDSIIYARSNALWQIGLDGSNNAKLFPLAETKGRPGP